MRPSPRKKRTRSAEVGRGARGTAAEADRWGRSSAERIQRAAGVPGRRSRSGAEEEARRLEPEMCPTVHRPTARDSCRPKADAHVRCVGLAFTITPTTVRQGPAPRRAIPQFVTSSPKPVKFKSDTVDSNTDYPRGKAPLKLRSSNRGWWSSQKALATGRSIRKPSCHPGSLADATGLHQARESFYRASLDG